LKQKQENEAAAVAAAAATAAAAAAAELPPPIAVVPAQSVPERRGSISLSQFNVTEVDPKDVVMGQLIGQGAFGQVFRGKLFGKEVAVKKLIVQELDNQSLDQFRAEVQVMSGLRHPNILLFMGACTQPGNLMIVTEIAYSSIDKMLKDKTNPPSFRQKLAWAKDTAMGINWLHCMKPPFLHLDVKAGNLLVDQSRTVKVSDFGMSAVKNTTGGRGTPLWMSPEMLLEKPYTEKTDIYSYGITLYEIFTEKVPFDNAFESYDELVDAVCLENSRPTIPPGIPAGLTRLIKSCWDLSADRRPSFAQILNEDTFQKILIEYHLPDTKASTLWSENFLEKEALPWPEFSEKLCNDLKLNRDPSKTAQLQILLSDNRGFVTIETFAQVVAVLGYDSELQQKAATLVGYSWFHGNLRPDESDRILFPQSAGTWMLTLNPIDPFQVFICVKSNSGVDRHVIIAKNGKFTFKNGHFDSLEAVIAKFGKDLNLNTVCPGTRYSYR